MAPKRPRQRSALPAPAAEQLPDAWTAWLLQVERLFVAFITVGALFEQREALTSLGAMRAAVERMAGAVFDVTTLRLIATLRTELVVLSEDVASTNDGPSVSLHFNLGKSKAVKTEAGAGPERPRAKNVFSGGKSQIRDVPKLVAAQTAEFRAAAHLFAVSHATDPPPPLCAHAAPATAAPVAAAPAAVAACCAGAADPAASHPDPTSGALSATQFEPGECDPLGNPWPEDATVDASSFCDWLRARAEYKSELVLRSIVPAREAQSVLLSQSCLSVALRRALSARGIPGLYTHQEAALREVLSSGRHVVVATSTASGKSIAYGAPVVQAVLDDPHARALLLFPTKALANDQIRSLNSLADAAGCNHFLGATFDGDTAEADRPQLRLRAHAFATNPDMLHATILPRHAEWAPVLRGLKIVVLDEAHTYHGVWGSHVALVLRRLRRLCAMYGSSPVFVCCSATIANPREHVSALTGLHHDSVACVSRDGGPSSRRTIALWRPALLPASTTQEWHQRLAPGAARRRVSSLAEAARLLAALVSHRIRTIAFVLTRGVAENLLAATRELLPDGVKNKVGRGGGVALTRRRLSRAPSSHAFNRCTATGFFSPSAGRVEFTILV
jgi:DEAD/DEAH box helicase domain-containing protein